MGMKDTSRAARDPWRCCTIRCVAGPDAGDSSGGMDEDEPASDPRCLRCLP